MELFYPRRGKKQLSGSTPDCQRGNLGVFFSTRLYYKEAIAVTVAVAVAQTAMAAAIAVAKTITDAALKNSTAGIHAARRETAAIAIGSGAVAGSGTVTAAAAWTAVPAAAAAARLINTAAFAAAAVTVIAPAVTIVLAVTAAPAPVTAGVSAFAGIAIASADIAKAADAGSIVTAAPVAAKTAASPAAAVTFAAASAPVPKAGGIPAIAYTDAVAVPESAARQTAADAIQPRSARPAAAGKNQGAYKNEYNRHCRHFTGNIPWHIVLVLSLTEGREFIPYSKSKNKAPVVNFLRRRSDGIRVPPVNFPQGKHNIAINKKNPVPESPYANLNSGTCRKKGEINKFR